MSLIDPLEPRLLLSSSPPIFISGHLLPAIDTDYRYVAAADFNNDGKLDVLGISVPHKGSTNRMIQAALNQGSDQFTLAGRRQLVSEAGESFAAADFDGDGNADLALFDQQKITLFAGHGDGSLTRGDQYQNNFLNFQLLKGDFNGDGRIDLAAIGDRYLSTDPRTGKILTESQIAVLLNDGRGRFSTAYTHIAGNNGLQAAIIDYDNNGKSDLAIRTADAVQFLASKGDGTFDFPAALPTGATSLLISADLNRDGRPDLLYSSYPSQSASYALALPSGGFAPIVHLPGGTGNSMGLAAGDFNGDGRTDILARQAVNDGSGLFFQQTNGTFAPAVDFSGINPAAVGDFNRGPSPARIMSSSSIARVTTFRSIRSGGWRSPPAWALIRSRWIRRSSAIS